MKTISLITAVVSYILISCIHPMNNESEAAPSATTLPETHTIEDRFPPPYEYVRTEESPSSFGSFLRNLPLKPQGSLVTYYNGEQKANHYIYDAVVDLPIGQRDLHQCADAVMRLRADYLLEQKRYDDIHFNFTNGFKADYARWKNGERIAVSGNKVNWKPGGQVSNSAENYWKYLEMVFSYAGTASLEKELKSAPIENANIGDVFIQGGFPGHAVIIVDKCRHKESGEVLVALAQSYMPAQEIQVLLNPNSKAHTVWYGLDGDELKTPEWTFTKNDLKRF
ncbi:MAG: DUF4846 domain-containing protein [Flavobacteriales bacterium]